MDSPEEAAALVASSLRLRLQGGSVLAVPIPPDQVGRPAPTTPFLRGSSADRLPPQAPAGRSIERAIDRAVAEAEEKGITGNQISPFLLARIAELTGGASLRSNIALVKHNARDGSLVAVHLSRAAPDLAPG